MPKIYLADYMAVASKLLGLSIPPSCEAGVQGNLELLVRHAAVVAKCADPETDPAELLRS